MKKSLIFLSVLTALSVASCGGSTVDTSKINLDYGYISKNEIASTSQLEISYDDLSTMITKQESFVLLIFHNRTCTCWTTFGRIAVQFMNRYNLKFFCFDNAYLEGKPNSYGIYTNTYDMPGICFFRRGELVRQTIYGRVSTDLEIFKDFEALEKYMFDNINLPKLYFLDKDSLDKKIADQKAFNLYVYKASCSDCGAIDKKFIHNWTDTTVKTGELLYIFDIEPYQLISQEVYQGIKDDYNLSNVKNTKLGYNTGYVPTFQRYNEGKLYDMITVLNDSGNKETGVVSSFFNSERIANSPLLSRTGNKYLFDGTTVDPSLIYSWGGIKQEKQLEWHTPVVELFFEEYIK